MNERSVHHATFTIERTYDAPPSRVFTAWADPAAKAVWSACHDEWQPTLHEFDFRVGGRERLHTGPAEGPVHKFDAIYYDIVQDERIVYAYEMHLGDKRISVSLATIELRSVGAGTVLVFTEQAIFLDGYDDVEEREEGTRVGLNRLAAVIEHEVVVAS